MNILILTLPRCGSRNLAWGLTKLQNPNAVYIDNPFHRETMQKVNQTFRLGQTSVGNTTRFESYVDIREWLDETSMNDSPWQWWNNFRSTWFWVSKENRIDGNELQSSFTQTPTILNAPDWNELGDRTALSGHNIVVRCEVDSNSDYSGEPMLPEDEAPTFNYDWTTEGDQMLIQSSKGQNKSFWDDRVNFYTNFARAFDKVIIMGRVDSVEAMLSLHNAETSNIFGQNRDPDLTDDPDDDDWTDLHQRWNENKATLESVATNLGLTVTNYEDLYSGTERDNYFDLDIDAHRLYTKYLKPSLKYPQFDDEYYNRNRASYNSLNL